MRAGAGMAAATETVRAPIERFGFDSRADWWPDELAKENWDNSQLLNEISWLIVTKIPKPHQNLDLALRIATRASSLENDENAMILDTVAWIYHEQGQLEEAIKRLARAVG